MYAYREDNKWTLCNLSSRFNGVGGFHLLTDEERAKYDFYKCVTVNEQYDPVTQNRSEEPTDWSLNGLVVTATYTLIDKDPAQVKTEIIAKKIKDGEQYIKDTVKGVVDAFNTKYGVTFDSIYNMAIYKDDADYPLHTQCDTLIKWQNSMWATARANQPKVIDGTMTDKEFLDALPVAPAV